MPSVLKAVGYVHVALFPVVTRTVLADVPLVLVGEYTEYPRGNIYRSKQDCHFLYFAYTQKDFLNLCFWLCDSVPFQHDVFVAESCLCVVFVDTDINYRWIQSELERCFCVPWSTRTDGKLLRFQCCAKAPGSNPLVSTSKWPLGALYVLTYSAHVCWTCTSNQCKFITQVKIMTRGVMSGLHNHGGVN